MPVFSTLFTPGGFAVTPFFATLLNMRDLPNSCYGVHILCEGVPVGMGRIVVYLEIVDVAVDPAHQGKGLGRGIMEKIVAWLDQHASHGAYVTLMADVPELYEKFGFKSVRPESEGMARVWKSPHV